jgi:5-methylcytosine-specific restriction endonuclease McrA
MLPKFFGLSRRDAEMLSVSIKPLAVAPVREVVTAVRVSALSSPAESRRSDPLPALIPGEPAPALRPAEPLIPLKRDAVEPLNGEQARFHVTVSRRFLEKLDRAEDALSHARPGATAEEILEAGLDLLLERQAKRNGVVEKPQTAVRPSTSDRIPAHVKRAVWKRASGRCEFILESGERCGCTTRLEYDHITPKALGGSSDESNVRLACRPHNDLAARLVFGDRLMDRYTRRGRALAQRASSACFGSSDGNRRSPGSSR